MSEEIAIIEIQPKMKTCKICKIELNIDRFNRRMAKCRQCTYQANKVYFKEYYQTNKEIMIERELIKYHKKQEDKYREQKFRNELMSI